MSARITRVTSRTSRRTSSIRKRIADILRKANYRGYLTLEHEADEEPLEAVPVHLDRLRDAASG